MGSGSPPYSLAWWRSQNFPPDVPVLGNILTSTSRAMLVGPTGAGKTSVAMAMSWSMAAGRPFLHWGGSGRPIRLLYIDSEMPPTLMASRAEDATRRLGEEPAGMFVLPKMLVEFPPLNTRAGQAYMDKLIAALEPDFIVFDNIKYLLVGDISKPEAWADINAWVLGLTSRRIGQLWLHHTGWNTTHGYGDSSKEWNFDTVMQMDDVDKTKVDFTLKFTKNRTATPATAHEYRSVKITLHGDRWSNNVVSTMPASHEKILVALAAGDGGMKHGELLEATKLKSSTLADALKALVAKGQIVKHEPSGLWLRGSPE
jgi:AAA domain